ncbi:alpha/beta hydrolase [Candidatus Omnitrophota bacterium]
MSTQHSITTEKTPYAKEAKSLITKDRKKILYDHYQGGTKDLIVIAHGFFNSKDSVLLQDLAKALVEEWDVIVLDFRGHGKNKNLFSWTAKEHLDLTAVLEKAKTQYEHIGVIGFSMGAATSIITATRTNMIDTLICVSTPTEFEKIDYHFWELDFENDILYNLFGEGRLGKGVRPGPFWLRKEKPIKCVKKVTCPIFFIHGEADWVIKPWHSKALYDAAESKKDIALIKNGSHAEYLMRKNRTETVILIKRWLNETMNGR